MPTDPDLAYCETTSPNLRGPSSASKTLGPRPIAYQKAFHTQNLEEMQAMIRDLRNTGLTEAKIAAELGVKDTELDVIMAGHLPGQPRSNQPRYSKNRTRTRGVVAALGGRCHRCGFDQPAALTLTAIRGSDKSCQAIAELNEPAEALLRLAGRAVVTCLNCKAVLNDRS